MTPGLRVLVYLVTLLCVSAVLSDKSRAHTNVFACEPEWAALANELGGERVSVFSATTAFQDHHHIEPRPSLIARIRGADLLVCSGAEVESGWLPILLTQSGNPRIQPGTPGYLETSQFVAKIEIPKVIDRALGDMHPSGNPHIHLDPRNIARIADILAARLEDLDPAKRDVYQKKLESFRERWRTATRRWEAQAAPLRNVPVIVYDKDYSYLIRWLGMREVGTLDPLPGMPPTPTHLAQLIDRAKRDPAKAVLYSPYHNVRAVDYLVERTNTPKVMLPFTVGGTERAKDLFGLFDDSIERLLATVARRD